MSGWCSDTNVRQSEVLATVHDLTLSIMQLILFFLLCLCSNLAGLGLRGVLPPRLFDLPFLQKVDLSRNGFTGTLPPQWSSVTLKELDVSNNLLEGPLPVAYGDKDTFPSLTNFRLDGNRLEGRLPGPEWLSNGFAPQAVITVRPGNEKLCGTVPVVDPKFYTTMPGGDAFPDLQGPTAFSVDAGFRVNTSLVYVVYKDLLIESNGGNRDEGSMNAMQQTNVVITNTLGSCAKPCGLDGTLPTTNLLEAALDFKVTLHDLLRYNPKLFSDTASVGDQIALPCDDSVASTKTKVTSDVAADMFAGGNQWTVVGTVGAEIAGALVRDSDMVGQKNVYYEGIMDWEWVGSGMSPIKVEPVYWFVDLSVSFTVTGITISSGNITSNLSIYVGDDLKNVFGNALVASNLNFGEKETRVIPIDNAKGRMVILYTGSQLEGQMSLAKVQVWAAESNIAVGKNIILSGSTTLSEEDGSIIEQPTVSGKESCSQIVTDVEAEFSIAVDPVYQSKVGTVIFLLKNASIAPGDVGTATVFVSDQYTFDDMESVSICGRVEIDEITDRVGIPCSLVGRYVGVHFSGISSGSLCDFQVFLEGEPALSQSTMVVQSKDIIGIIVGSVLAGAFLVIIIFLGIICIRKRKKARKLHVNSFPDAEKGMKECRKDSASSNSDTALTSPRKMAEVGVISREQSDDSPIRTEVSSRKPSDLVNISECDLIQFSDIELVKTIGEGSYGLVWLGRYLQTTVAVKVLTHDTKRAMGFQSNDKEPSEGALLALWKEASIMAALRHPNCVQYLGCCLDPPSLVMEYCSRKSVDTILKEARNDPKVAKQLDWVHLLGIAADAAKGMLYLHSRFPPIIHRDLKSPNLLVDGLWHVKVSDFNLSRAMEQDSCVSSVQITNPRWLAPEVLKGGQGGKASDVYSFGVVLWELMTWKLPWGEESNPFSIINTVTEGKQLPIPDSRNLPGGELPCYKEYVNLMTSCWNMNPNQRPKMEEIAQDLRNMLTDLVRGKILSARSSSESSE